MKGLDEIHTSLIIWRGRTSQEQHYNRKLRQVIRLIKETNISVFFIGSFISAWPEMEKISNGHDLKEKRIYHIPLNKPQGLHSCPQRTV